MKRLVARRKALVLGIDTRSFLSVIRSLGRAGVQVHVAGYPPDGPALRSRYITQVHELPPYDAADGLWLAAIDDLMRQEAFDLVIPCDDRSVIALQTNRQELEKLGRLYTMSDRAFETLFNKVKTNQLARSVGVPVPRELPIANREQARAALAAFGPPVVLKPNSSHTVADPTLRRAVKKAYTEEELDRYVDEMLTSGPLTAQENFIGRGVGVELLLKDGKPLLTFQHERVHEPLHGGGSSYRKSVAVSPHLLEAAVKLLQPLNYTGVAMAEFKVNPETGDWVLIEVNARFWGSLPLALAAGADFPLALFQMLVDGRTSFPSPYRQRLHSRYLVADMCWLWANLRADKSDATLATRPLARVLFDAVANTLTLRERIDTFTLDDPGPGLAEVYGLLRGARSCLSGRTKRWCFQSLTGRWVLAWRAVSALRAARTVLFVCKGNVCRSPFAERFARKNWHWIETIASAGYYPKENRKVPVGSLTTGARWSVDLSNHRSRLLTEELVRQADVILVFDWMNHKRVIDEYGFASDKVHFLGVFSAAGPLFIEDPWGQQPDFFQSVYERIANAILNAAHRAGGKIEEATGASMAKTKVC